MVGPHVTESIYHRYLILTVCRNRKHHVVQLQKLLFLFATKTSVSCKTTVSEIGFTSITRMCVGIESLGQNTL